MRKKIREEYKKTSEKIPQLLVSSYLNLAAVFLKEKLFSQANEMSKKAIEVDPQNPKGYFRLAKTLRGIDDFEGAIRQLEKALEISPANKDVQTEIAEVKALLKEQIHRQKKAFSGMFDRASEGIYADAKPAGPEKWKCNYCGEEMDAIQQARHILKKHSGNSKVEF